MSILGELQKSNPGAIVELFEIDTTIVGGTIYRFHAGTNQIGGSVVWQGNTYNPFPIQASGFEVSGQQFPRPKIAVANVSGVISTLVAEANDLLGSKVTRRRTLVQYLDAVNFPGGVNPSADPSAYLPDQVFYVVQKTQETGFVVEFELGSPLDLQGVMIPRRQIIGNLCGWRYRADGCGYAGGPVADVNDNPTSDAGADNCSRRLTGCKLRFGANGELPYGGFPAADLVRM